MACILIATAPVESHFNPMATVAHELVNRRHTVWWYAGKVFQPKIERLGATYKPMNAAYDFSGMSREEAFPKLHGLQGLSALIETLKALFIEQAPKQMKDILSLIVAGATEEKPEIAARVAWAGVGINLKTGTPSSAQIRDAVKTLLRDSSYKDNAHRLQAEFQRYNGPQRAADLIEQLLHMSFVKVP